MEECDLKWSWVVEVDLIGNGEGGFKTRNEAYKMAFNEANKIVNNGSKQYNLG